MTAVRGRVSLPIPKYLAGPAGEEKVVGLRILDAERQQYADDGFFVRKDVFGAADLVRFRAAAERVVHSVARSSAEDATAGSAQQATGESESNYHIDGNRYIETPEATVQFEHASDSETIRVIEPFHQLDSVFDELIQDPRIVTPICGLLGLDRVALWTDKINLKRPREGSGFRWHQDSPYWSHVCKDTDRLLNVLVTLDDATEENGCFRVIRGSHRKGFLPGIQDGSELGPLFTDPSAFEEGDQVAAEVPAGSQVFFAAHSVHGSQPNHSNEARRALVLTYQPGGRPMFKIPEIRNAA